MKRLTTVVLLTITVLIIGCAQYQANLCSQSTTANRSIMKLPEKGGEK